jgi:hypothetical protein
MFLKERVDQQELTSGVAPAAGDSERPAGSAGRALLHGLGQGGGRGEALLWEDYSPKWIIQTKLRVEESRQLIERNNCKSNLGTTNSRGQATADGTRGRGRGGAGGVHRRGAGGRRRRSWSWATAGQVRPGFDARPGGREMGLPSV